jgi:hypothetical protein
MRRDVFVADEQAPAWMEACIVKQRRDRRKGLEVDGVTAGAEVDLDSHGARECLEKTAVLHALKMRRVLFSGEFVSGARRLVSCSARADHAHRYAVSVLIFYGLIFYDVDSLNPRLCPYPGGGRPGVRRARH